MSDNSNNLNCCLTRDKLWVIAGYNSTAMQLKKLWKTRGSEGSSKWKTLYNQQGLSLISISKHRPQYKLFSERCFQNAVKKAVVIVNVTVLSVLLPTFFTTKNAIIRSFILVYCYFKFQVSLIEIWFFPLIIWYLPLDGLIKPVFLLFSTLLITSLIETKQRV